MASTALKLSGKVALPLKDSKIQFIFTGFKQEEGFRVFGFQNSAKEFSNILYTVRADLALARSYGIQTQDLPLLSRALLERCLGADEQRNYCFTEDDMRLHASDCKKLRNAALLKKKARFKPPSVTNGVGWRAPQQQVKLDR